MTAMARHRSSLLIVLGALAASAHAQPPPPARPDGPPPAVIAKHLVDDVYLLTGGGGANSTMLVGSEGTLLVDSKSAAVTVQIVDIATKLRSGPFRYLVNTHEHPDHTDGNAHFGDLGAVIVAHQGVRDVLAMGQRGGPPSPPIALPSLTYPDGGGVTLHLDSETIHVFHAPPAHSPSNSIVHFVNANVLHVGDLYGPNRYQLIVGGTFQGFIAAADEILSIANDDTKIVPGVGPVGTRADFIAYRKMLVTVRDRVAQLVAQGKTLEEVIAAHPTAEFDATWGSPDHPLFLPVIYAELKK
jgi:cyclase